MAKSKQNKLVASYNSSHLHGDTSFHDTITKGDVLIFWMGEKRLKNHKTNSIAE